MKVYKIAILYIISIVSINQTVLGNEWVSLIKPQIINNGTGYSTTDIAYSVTKDASGNYYITGFFDGRLGIGNDTLVSSGSRDIFVAKFHSSGTPIWARRAGGNSAELGKDIAVDGSGNVYVTGYFYGTSTFGNYTITSTGNSDLFIAKLNSSGTWQWAKSAGSSGFERANSIALESSNSCYITGSFEGTATFGTLTVNSSGNKDIFVAKINSSGVWQWVKSAGGSTSDEANTIKFSSSKIVVGGYFSSTANFGTSQYVSNGLKDIFVSFLNTSGDWLLTKTAGGTGNDDAKSLIIDNQTNVAVTGSFSNSITFGDSTFNSNGSKDVFLAKLDLSGNWINSIQAGGIDDDEGTGIGFDNSDNLFVCGNFYQSCSFGDFSLSSSGDKDVFVAKLDNNLGWNWVSQAKSVSTIESFGIICDNSGNAIITGSFFRIGEFDSYQINSSGEADILIAKISATGSWTNAVSYAGLFGVINSQSMAVDKKGNKYICGGFYGKVKFGNDTLTSLGYEDIFVAKLNKANEFLWAKSAGGIDIDKAYSIALDSSNRVIITGNYSGLGSFGSQEIQSAGFTDIFVAILDTAGLWQNVVSAGSELPDRAMSVSVNTNKIYVAGGITTDAQFGSISLINIEEEDIFVAKLDLDLNWIWAKKAGGNGFDSAISIVCDKNENIFLTGYFENTANFDSYNVTAIGYDDIFVASIDLNGNFNWVKSSGSDYMGEQGNSIVTDDDNAIYITGTFVDVCGFGSDYLVSKGGSDIFVSKLDYEGNYIWSKAIGSSLNDEGIAINYYKSNIYVTGTYSNTLIYNYLTIINNGGKDVLLFKFNTSGVYQSKETGGMSYDDEVSAMSIDYQGNISLLGSFYNSTKFGQLQFSNFNSKDRNSYIAKFGLISPANFWTYKANTGKSSQIKLPVSINPKFAHRDLQDGDAVGVFYTRNSNLYCAGWGLWESEDLTFTAWGDDTNTLTKDGFASNEYFTLKLWDATRGNDTIVSVRFGSGTQYFLNDTISILSRVPDSDDTLSIPLKKGWNMIASTVYPYHKPRMDSIFTSIKSNLKIVKNNTGKTYFPEMNLNTIGNWNILEAYMVYCTNPDTLKMIGYPIDPDTTNIPLIKGWNLVPYLKSSSLTVVSALQSISTAGKLKIAKNISGKIYMPIEGFNNLINMYPKEGYQMYMLEAGTLKYP